MVQCSNANGGDPSALIDAISPSRMLERVTVSAQQLEVVEVHCDFRTFYVARRDVYLVMYYNPCVVPPVPEAFLAETADALRVCESTTLPRLGLIKPFRIFFHGNVKGTAMFGCPLCSRYIVIHCRCSICTDFCQMFDCAFADIVNASPCIVCYLHDALDW